MSPTDSRDFDKDEMRAIVRITERDRAATLAAIARSLEELAAGRFYTLEQVDKRIRDELGFAPRQQ